MESLGDASKYWNIAWVGRPLELYQEILLVNSLYFETHTYIPGETDCNDMAIDIWNMLMTDGIVSLIMVGNLEMSQERFQDCNHAWLVIYNADGAALALEPTNGEIYTWEDAQIYPHLMQYWEGFVYEKPSDLRADLKERW